MVVGTAKAIAKGTKAHPPNIHNLHESFQEAGVNMGVDRYLQLKQQRFLRWKKYRARGGGKD